MFRRLVEVLAEDYKMSKVEIAKRLGITPSAVTRYLKKERGARVELSKWRDVDSRIKELAAKVVSGTLSEYDVQEEVIKVVFYTLGKRYLCSFHRELEPSVDLSKCDICDRAFKRYTLEST